MTPWPGYQDRPPDPAEQRGLRFVRHGDGTGEIRVTLTDVELEELAAGLRAFLDAQAPGDESSREDSPTLGTQHAGRVRRADAFMELVRVGLAHHGDGHAVGADRYLVPDGTPIGTTRPVRPPAPVLRPTG